MFAAIVRLLSIEACAVLKGIALTRLHPFERTAPAMPTLGYPAWTGNQQHRRTWIIYDPTWPVPEGYPRYVGGKG